VATNRTTVSCNIKALGQSDPNLVKLMSMPTLSPTRTIASGNDAVAFPTRDRKR
jgi:hypothetical protein